MTKRELVRRAKACGSNYFNRDTMQFFNSRIERVYEGERGIAAVVSNQFDETTPRRYNVVVLDEKACKVNAVAGGNERGIGGAYRFLFRAEEKAKSVAGKKRVR